MSTLLIEQLRLCAEDLYGIGNEVQSGLLRYLHTDSLEASKLRSPRR
jgi:hypothetical protein